MIPLTANAQLLPGSENQVYRHPVQPGTERGLTPESPEFVPHSNEHVLRDLIGQLGLEHSGYEGVHPGYVPAIQTLEHSTKEIVRAIRGAGIYIPG